MPGNPRYSVRLSLANQSEMSASPDDRQDRRARIAAQDLNRPKRGLK